MNKQTIIFLFGLTLSINQVTGQNFKQEFNDLFSKNDTAGQRQLLGKWQIKDRKDPELFVAYFNYYVKRSMSEIVRLDKNPKGENVLQLMNQDTSIKEPAGYMYSDVHYEPKLLSQGFLYIHKGIEINPTRLDMRFGCIHMFGQTQDYENFTKEIIKTIDYSAVIKNKWTWEDNKPVEDPKKFFLGAIQDYSNQLYDTGNDSLLENMKRIAESVLKYYPDHVESLTNISIVYLIQKKLDKALVVLLKAEKLAHEDTIVLNNIAQAYKLKGDKENSIKYYELAIKYGDDRTKEYSKKQIEDLKRQ